VTDGRTYMVFAAWVDGIIGNESGHRAMFLMALVRQHGETTLGGASTFVVRTRR
jgi:hypothetical protein